MGTIDWNDVAIFVRVASEMSFTIAAKKLALPKSTVSRAVVRVERALGAQLLHRTTRSLRLTEVGAAYYERARAAITDLESATSDAVRQDRAPRGVIRMTTTHELGATYLAPVLPRFTERYPAIRVETVLTNRTVDLVAEGIDVAIRAGRMRDSSYVARKIVDTELVLVASPGYLARRGTPSEPADLEAHDAVLFRGESGRASLTMSGPRGSERVTLRGRLQADDFDFIRNAALADGGIGLTPRFLCQSELESGRLIRVLPAHALRGAALFVVYPSGGPSEKVALFRDFVIAALSRITKPV